MSEQQGPEFAAWTRSIRRSALEDMLVETAKPDVISLALGLPAPDLFPTDGLAQCVDTMLREDARALQYGPPVSELRSFIATLMKRRGVDCSPEQVFLTAGAQQAMSLLARTLLDPRDIALVEEVAYTGFQQVLAAQDARVATVPTRVDTGIDLDALEQLLERGLGPSLLYTMSDGANPTGASIPASDRSRLTQLARKWRVPILEDDAYGMLAYGETPPALRSYDPDWVFYLGSFSKTLSPALRTGWLVAPERFALPLASLKESSDINTATLGQRTVAAFVASGQFDAHLLTLRTEYRRRRDALLEAVQRHFPPGTHSSTPLAGFFTWVDLPRDFDTESLLRAALQNERVAFLPGSAFLVRGSEAAASEQASHLHVRSALRLNFSFSPVPVLEEGVRRIARTIEMADTRSRTGFAAPPGNRS